MGCDAQLTGHVYKKMTCKQWRRQHLLGGGAKLEIMSWGTHGGLQGRVQQLLDDY